MDSQAQGFPGHMFTEVKAGNGQKFYSYVRESAWLQEPGVKPSEYSDLHEAFPYWFNGLVPLAYSLQNGDLKAQVHQAAQAVLDLQADDGWLGPEDYLRQERVLWGRYPLFLGLIQLAEANATWTDPVVVALRKFMGLANQILRAGGTGYNKCQKGESCMWSQVRVADLMITIQWLIENHASESEDQVLWETMGLLQAMNGYKWEGWYVDGVYQQVVSHPSPDQWFFGFIHGVNVGQGLKSPAVLRRFTHNDSLLDTAQRAVNLTTFYHGSPSGSILGDEIIRDKKPYMGSELCTAVETGYSLAYLYQATGDQKYADAAELVYFNALPVQTAHKGWGHQYMDQPNQPFAQYEKGWELFTTSNGGSATIYGLEPFYPCCAVNFPQGYAKLTTHSWAFAEQGIAHLLLGPSQVTTQVGGHNVTVKCTTNYPFDGTLNYVVQADDTFYLHLRVPSWYNPETTNLKLNGTDSRKVAPDSHTGMHKISLPKGETSITYTLGMEPRYERRDNGAVSVYVGNLLYSLDVGSEENSTLPHPFHSAVGEGMDYIPFAEARDYSYESTKPWNVAIDPKSLKFHSMGADDELPLDPFVYEGATTYIEVQGCEVSWPLLKDVTPDVPPKDPSCTSAVKTYVMKPYGALKAHMSELPVLEPT